MAKKLLQHTAEDVEVINVSLTPTSHPKFFKAKVDELVKLGLSQEEAEADVTKWMSDFEMEVYYQTDYGVFAVDSEAFEGGQRVYSPFTKTELKDPEDEA